MPANPSKKRKPHIVTDTQGFLLAAQCIPKCTPKRPANIQDWHGTVPLLRAPRQTCPKLSHIFADLVYRGEQRHAIANCGP
jgi:hypothetical protein